MNEEEVLQKIKEGGIGVFPTDTLYALSGSAFSENAVRRIFEVKRRGPEKPLIILIGSLEDLGLFKIQPNEKELKILERIWPGKFSVIFHLDEKGFDYLHRGTGSLAFRLPGDAWLRSFLEKSGPIVAPSANPEGLPPAKSIAEAKEYFGKNIDFYFDKGPLDKDPSTLVSLKDGRLEILRPGGKEEVRLAESLQ